MAKTFEEIIAASKTEVETALASVKTAYASGNTVEVGKARAKLKEAVDNNNKISQNAVFKKCVESEKPFETFAKEFTYPALKVKEIRDKNNPEMILGMETEPCQRRLNIGTFVEKCNMDGTILSDIKALFTTLYIRMNNIIKLTPADLAKESVFFCQTVKQKEAGKTPDSNTQITKMLQGILAKCNVKGRVTNRELLFLQQCSFVHDAKGKCRMKKVTDGKFNSIIVDVMNHMVEGTEYTLLEEKQKKNTEA